MASTAGQRKPRSCSRGTNRTCAAMPSPISVQPRLRWSRTIAGCRRIGPRHSRGRRTIYTRAAPSVTPRRRLPKKASACSITARGRSVNCSPIWINSIRKASRALRRCSAGPYPYWQPGGSPPQLQLRMICNSDPGRWGSGSCPQDSASGPTARRDPGGSSRANLQKYKSAEQEKGAPSVRLEMPPPMSRRPPFRTVFAGAGVGLLAFGAPAGAADLPVIAPVSRTLYDWSGWYLGGHVGYGGGSFGPGTNPLPEQGVLFPHSITGLIGGYQAGYLRQLSSHVVVGIEADASFTGPLDVPALIPAPFHTTIDYVGTVRGRAGYASGTLLAYVTGGFAWGHSHININDAPGAIVSSPGQNQLGWTAGAGVEFAVSGNWSAKLEYDYTDLARRTYDLSGFGLPAVNVDPNIHLVKLGLNYRFGDTPPWTAPDAAKTAAAKTALPESTDWNVHAQTTFLPTGYPAFRSPY